jgi:hypothetical protein
VHLVTLLEDMPVQETSDADRRAQGVGLPVGSSWNMARRAGALPEPALVPSRRGA